GLFVADHHLADLAPYGRERFLEVADGVRGDGGVHGRPSRPKCLRTSASYPGGTGILGTAASARCPAARSARVSAAGARGGSVASPGPARPAWARAARGGAERWLVAAAPPAGAPQSSRRMRS